MMDPGIMHMHHVNPVAAQAAAQGEHRSQGKTRRLMKRHHGNTGGLQTGGEASGLKQAIDQDLMAGLFLRHGEVRGHPLQAPQLQVLD